jgi:hypothetical protein
VSLSGCGKSDDKPSSSMTEVTIACDKYADTAKKITDAQAEIYSGAGGSTEAVDALLFELDGLKKDAPADIDDALTEMSDGFRQAQQVMASPTPENTKKLADLGPKLSADGQKITAYIVSKCK